MSVAFTDLRGDIELLRRFLTQRAYTARLIEFARGEGIFDAVRAAKRFTASEFLDMLRVEAGYKTVDGRGRMAGVLLDFLEECGMAVREVNNAGTAVYSFKDAPPPAPLSADEERRMEEVFGAKIEFFDRCMAHAGVFLRGGGHLYTFDADAALSWDRFLGNFEFRVARDFLINAMGASGTPSPRILDLCCGTGHGLETILRQWPDARVTALDFTETMRHVALARVGRHNGAIRWTGSAQWNGFGSPLPFAGRGFDMVFFSCGDPYIPEHIRAGVYGEIKRVLRPGGLLGSVAWAYPDRDKARVAGHWQRLGVFIHDFAESVCAGWRGFHGADETIKMAEALGFERCGLFMNNYYMLDTAVWLFRAPETKR
ncbi:MAG: class I SAM-dependent methyltransferase [Deltaproteobacteria bacterium]|nr:class I SAM-dependent methyltransferase [Deltaproteobacteria bacterium]